MPSACFFFSENDSGTGFFFGKLLIHVHLCKCYHVVT